MKNIIFLSITLIGFGLSFVFYLFKPPPYTLVCVPELQCAHWVVFRPEMYFDKHSHFYLLGERVLIAIAFVGAWLMGRNLVTFITAILFLLYIGDYILFFNDPLPWFGNKYCSYAYFMAGALTIMWVVEIIKLIAQWKQQAK